MDSSLEPSGCKSDCCGTVSRSVPDLFQFKSFISGFVIKCLVEKQKALRVLPDSSQFCEISR